MQEFLQFIEETNTASDVDALFATYLKYVRQHGLDKIVFCLETSHEDIGLHAGHGIVQNYPQDWMQHYVANNLGRIDPVRVYGRQQVMSFTWEEIPKKMDLTRQQWSCLNMGIESGLYHGLCTPLYGANGKIAAVGLASSHKIDGFDGKIDLIHHYSYQLYHAFQRLHERKKPLENLYLTERETEILCWSAQGKSNPVIADIMHISTDTVKYHWKRIFEKLQMNSRHGAIAKAIAYGLITP